jgi:hypothetical protein
VISCFATDCNGTHEIHRNRTNKNVSVKIKLLAYIFSDQFQFSSEVLSYQV